MMLTDMPDEILIYTAMYLDLYSTLNYGLLSKRFLNIANKVINSRKNVYITVPQRVCHNEASRVAARFAQKDALALYYGMRDDFNYCCEILPPTSTLYTLSTAFAHCKDLHISCYRNTTSHLSVRRICYFMPWLRTLTVEYAIVNEDDIVAALKDMTHLKRVILIYITGISEKWLTGLPSSIEKVYWALKQEQPHTLQDIIVSEDAASNIKEFSFICDDIDISSSSNMINVISEKFCNIMSLELSVKQISLSSIQKLNIPSLELLKLEVRGKIISDLFNPFSKSYVTALSLEFHFQSDDSMYVKLFNYFRNIKKLSINCTAIFLTKEICHCICNLYSLNIFEFIDHFWAHGKHLYPSSEVSVPVELCKRLTHVVQFLVHINLFMNQTECNKIVDDFQSITLNRKDVNLCLYATPSMFFL